MPILSPAVKVGAVIPVIISVPSVVLDVVGWNMVDMATRALLIGLLARSALVGFPGTMSASMEGQVRQAAWDGSPDLKPSQID